MKIAFPFLLSVLVSLGTSCARDHSFGAGTVDSKSPGPAIGTLVVYSEWARLSDSSDSTWSHHTGYSISSPDGKLFRKVKNHTTGPDTRPEPVSLPVGKYVVKARTRGFVWVSVPVTIQNARTTAIYLDGTTHPENR